MLVSLSIVKMAIGHRHVWVYTIDRMTTHGRFSLLTMAWDNVDLPEPELPATPMMLRSAHGGL